MGKVDEPSEGLSLKSISSNNSIKLNFQEGASTKSKPSEGLVGQSPNLGFSKSLKALNIHSVKISEILPIESKMPSISSMSELKTHVAEYSQTPSCSKVQLSHLVNSKLAKSSNSILNGALANYCNIPIDGSLHNSSSNSLNDSLAKSNLKNTSSCPPVAESSDASRMKEDESVQKTEMVINSHTTAHNSENRIVESTDEKSVICQPQVASPLPPTSLGGLGLLMNSYGSDDDEDDDL